MIRRMFGNTGLEVSVLGFGAMHISADKLSDKEAETLLHTVIDSGINLIDTARGYRSSEERIGKFLSGRRNEIVISTKIGYDIPGYEDWTYDCIVAGVDAALKRLQTDYIDIVHFHSCPLATLEQGDITRALEEAVRAGKVRSAAYSGDNEALGYAIASDRFNSVQCSVNLCDQTVIDHDLPALVQKEMGVIAKRPIANAPWRFDERPVGDYSEVYWTRWKQMDIDPNGIDWQELALRFTAFLPGVHSCIVGTSSLDHLLKNIELVNKGALPQEMVDTIRHAYQTNDSGWVSQC
ncbi:aldo/keto reductase [Paenibacillus oenotherae]|uniref:Aldo/keto reductase n=1 Tax=Paenibacillus oenotherae TaxID=1435645 RepID=A0ABS7D5S5_9BACL|nr:aldo/keto reductase [Paenibacillus oenotherae]MBW7475297.1 aldo/keto reductase [Paenibacillus oenotherae]